MHWSYHVWPWLTELSGVGLAVLSSFALSRSTVFKESTHRGVTRSYRGVTRSYRGVTSALSLVLFQIVNCTEVSPIKPDDSPVPLFQGNFVCVNATGEEHSVQIGTVWISPFPAVKRAARKPSAQHANCRRPTDACFGASLKETCPFELLSKPCN